ncbi:MAG: OmpA family protein [Paludibacter sp.]|nr:OmpA family protein [Paludibacter sp.]
MRSKVVSYFILLLIVLLLLPGCGIKSRLVKADKKFEAGEYASASIIYGNLYSRIPYKEGLIKAKVAYKQAECYRFLNNTRSEMMYSRAIRTKYPDSLVYLRYAQSLHRNAKYTEAAKNYRIYLQNDSANRLAINGLQATQQVAVWKNEPTRYVVKRESDLYVRNNFTFSPVFPANDQGQLFFSSTRTKPQKGVVANAVTNLQNSNVFIIKKDAAGKWSKPEPVLPDAVTTNADIGACAFSPDGKKMFFTRAMQKNESDASAEIFVVARAGGEWTEPQKINFFKDSTISVAHPAIAPDGETIYFVSDAPNGEGGKDIWKGTLSGSECKYIENLGPQINTPGDEMFPVVRSDGTLYFSSNGHPGLGGLDIFKATKISEQNWSVQHMGIPLNSNYDDFGMTFEGGKEKGFFTSNRGQTRGFDAIWNFELPEMEVLVLGKVLDDKLNPIPDAMVRLVSNTGQNTKVITKKDGSYRIKIDKNMDCVMLGTARGFLNKTEKLSSRGVKDSKIFTVDLILPAAFRPVQLENIFFEFAKWDLTPSSEKGLQDLLAMLNDNPNIIIEISAHTDYVGNNAANLILSQKRAQSVVDYLIKAGISEKRLVSVGHGEEKPYKVDEGLALKYAFLPLDTLLTEEFIQNLNPEEQQIANQINRRTEFKVLRMNIW